MLMSFESEGEDKHDHAHQVDEDFHLVESYFSSNQYEVSHDHIRGLIGSDKLLLILRELSLQLLFLSCLYQDYIYADYDLEYCFP